jgi:hypothetical protein
MTLIGIVGCSGDKNVDPMTCSAMRARVAEIEATPPPEGQSWDNVQASTDLSIERDTLRAQIASSC